MTTRSFAPVFPLPTRTTAWRRWLRDLLAENAGHLPNHATDDTPPTDDTREEPARSPQEAREPA